MARDANNTTFEGEIVAPPEKLGNGSIRLVLRNHRVEFRGQGVMVDVYTVIRVVLQLGNRAEKVWNLFEVGKQIEVLGACVSGDPSQGYELVVPSSGDFKLRGWGDLHRDAEKGGNHGAAAPGSYGQPQQPAGPPQQAWGAPSAPPNGYGAPAQAPPAQQAWGAPPPPQHDQPAAWGAPPAAPVAAGRHEDIPF